MRAYTTLDDEVINIEALTAEERDHLERCLELWRGGIEWMKFTPYVYNVLNPLVVAAGGRVTRQVHEHPLQRILMDIDDRMGIAQGHVAADDTSDLRDPFRHSEETISTTEAAALKGVRVMSVHRAVERGDLLAEESIRGTKQRTLKISVASLEAWTPKAEKQRAGRAGGLARAS